MSSPEITEDHRKSQLGPYFLELDEITSIPEKDLSSPSSGNVTEDEKEDVSQDSSSTKTKITDGAEEVAWLNEAGLSNLASPFQEGQELDSAALENATSTLTKSQAATVKKRVDKLNETLRNKKETEPDATDSKKRDVREIFPDQNNPPVNQHVGLHPTDGTEAVRRTHHHRKRRSRTAPEHRVIETALVKNYKDTTTGIAAVDQGVKILSFTHTEPVEVPSAKEIVGFDGSPAVTPNSTLEAFRAEELNGVNQPFIRQEELFKNLTTSLPNITLDNDLLGTTPVDFLSARDIEKVRQISLIELTAMFDRVGICYRPIRKSSKKKIKEVGVFGVPLSILVERDRELKPECEVPIFLQRLIAYIEEHGLREEGVLRVPGSTSRIKELQQEVEKCFYEGAFKFQNLRVNDAVGLLKLFLRELPSPPLTLEYVNAFSSVEQITDRKKQLQCLNLLILVLPDVYRATLKILLSFLSKIVQNENYNRMSLNNVAMIMAPNLFSVKNISSRRVVDFAELAFAAGTSNITRMLVKYHDILWVVPSRMLEQVRKMVDFDIKKNRESKSVMTIFNKKGKEKRRSMLEDVLEGIIRIQTPGDEEKVFTTVQLSEHTTADDIVAKFTQDMHPIATPILRRPQSRGVRRSRRSKTLDKNSAFDSLAGVPPNKTVRFYLYETGGNIGSRCLDPETNMLALVRVNPGAEWIIRPRVV